MYKTVNSHIQKHDINSAMGECIRGNFYHLGMLLGSIKGKGDSQFYTLLGQLIENAKGTNKDNIIVNEDVKTVEETVVEKKVEEHEAVVEKKVEETVVENKEDMIKIKLLCNWATSEDIAHMWNKMSKGNFTWDNIKMVWNEEPDYYVVLNRPPINEFPPADKTILFRMEPYMEKNKKLWGEWSAPNPSLFMWAGYHELAHNNNEWHLSKTYDELRNSHPVKDPSLNTVISTVLSAKYKDPGHIKRIDFVKFLEKKGINIHVYGDNKWEYKNYRGELPYHAKDDGLFPYKYTFNVENHNIRNYYTEKIIDGILSECLVFYSGCYNLKEFLPEDSFVQLDLSNFEKDYEIIKTAIAENWWEKRLPAIREAKRIILEERQFFPRVKKIIDEYRK